MTVTLTLADFQALDETQRRSVLAALFLVASVDGQMDAPELALARPFLELTAAVQLGPVQAEARAAKSPRDVYALGQRCAEALPEMGTRERLVSLLLGVAWADGAVAAQELNVLSMLMHGIGLSGERANELAEAAAETSIFGAISRGKVGTVRKLLDGGVAVMSRDPRQWTPLHVAVATGQGEIVDLLLERGADVHARHSQGSPPLFLACNKPLTAIVERLIRAGARVEEAGAAGLTPLIIASLTGQTGIARVLRNAGAPLEATDGSGRTALYCAASEARATTVAFLVSEGAAVNVKSSGGATPLMAAAERGDLATVSALLAARADVRAVDKNAQTALHYAVAGNAPEIVAMLLALGADPSAASDTKTTPLHVAAAGGRTACARLLLDAGAQRDATNTDGATPVLHAALLDKREVHDLLVLRGATADASKIGAALSISSLRAAPGEPLTLPPRASALRPSDAALGTFDDYQVAMWLNIEGKPDQVLIAGKDAKGRPEWVARAGKSEPRARFLIVNDTTGKRWLPLFTSEAAASAFRTRVDVGWPEQGTGLASAVMGSIDAGVLRLGDLPVDGVVLDPYGPNGPVALSADECDRAGRRR